MEQAFRNYINDTHYMQERPGEGITGMVTAFGCIGCIWVFHVRQAEARSCSCSCKDLAYKAWQMGLVVCGTKYVSAHRLMQQLVEQKFESQKTQYNDQICLTQPQYHNALDHDHDHEDDDGQSMFRDKWIVQPPTGPHTICSSSF